MKKLEPAIQFHNPGNTLSVQYGDRFKKAFEDRRKAYLNEFSELLFSTFDKNKNPILNWLVVKTAFSSYLLSVC